MAAPMFRLLLTPYNMKNRQIILNRNIRLVDCIKQENGYFIKFNIYSTAKNRAIYNVNIWVETLNIINTNTPIEVNCDCPSFKYQFETVLWLNKFLLGEVTSKKLPKKQVLATCKHIQTCLKYLLNLRSISNILDKF